MGKMIAYALLTQARASPDPDCPGTPTMPEKFAPTAEHPRCSCGAHDSDGTPIGDDLCSADTGLYCNRTPGQAGYWGMLEMCVKDCAEVTDQNEWCKGSNHLVCRKKHVDTTTEDCPPLCSVEEGNATKGCVCEPFGVRGFPVHVKDKGYIVCQCAAGGTCNKKGTSFDCSDVCLAPTGKSPDPASTGKSPDSAPTGKSPDPDGSTPSSNTAAIIGGSIAAVALVGIGVSVYVWRTHRIAKDKHAKRKQANTLRGRKSRRTKKGKN